MIKTLIVSGLILVGFSSYAGSGEKTACFHVEGMTCATCSLTLKAAVKKLDGISKVEASVENKNAIVDFDPKKTNANSIGKKIDSVGYKSTKRECSNVEG